MEDRVGSRLGLERAKSINLFEGLTEYISGIQASYRSHSLPSNRVNEYEKFR